MQTSKSYPARAIEDIRPLKLNCFSFLQNEIIPSRYTSDGININPPIYIDDVPEDTQSLVLIVEDPDVPHDSFCHWLAWNIPVTHYIKEKENRGICGINDFGHHSYNGPHPFSMTHRYFFSVYALDCLLDLSIRSSKTELKKAMEGHVIGRGTVIGKYGKQSHSFKDNLALSSRPIPDEEMKALLNEKGCCISLVLTIRQLPANQASDHFHLKKAIKEVVSSLSEKNIPGTGDIISTLEGLQNEIVLHQSDRGVGIYASRGLSFYTSLPFEVPEKIMIDEGFHVKDLLIKEQYSIPYTVLYIDDKEIRLYNGKLNQLAEVKNKELPMFFEDGSDDSSGYFARNGFSKSGDRNPNDLAKEKRKVILHKADELLGPYLQRSHALVLCGVRKYLTEFMDQTLHAEKIINILYGNYNRFTEADFGEMIWPILKTHVDHKTADEIAVCNEKMAVGLTEEGIVHVWDAILSDRGATLLVEKNFAVKGFVEHRDPMRLYLHEPKDAHLVLEDAVNELVKTALAKEVKIVFVEDGMLNRNMRIVLITRF